MEKFKEIIAERQTGIQLVPALLAEQEEAFLAADYALKVWRRKYFKVESQYSK